MTKQKFIELFERWNEISYDMRDAFLTWYNTSFNEIDICNPFWDNLPDDINEDCISELTDKEFDELLEGLRDNVINIFNLETFEMAIKMIEEGHFVYYECSECSDEVRQGFPDNWDNFQGVAQDEGIGSLCSSCYGTYERLKMFAGE